MPTIGTMVVNKLTVEKDAVLYATADNTVSHVDTVALRRTLPAKQAGSGTMTPLRTNVRGDRGFVVGDTEKVNTVSIAAVVHPGTDPVAFTAYVKLIMADWKNQFAEQLAINGDIHLD